MHIFILSSFAIASSIRDTSSFGAIMPIAIITKSSISINSSICIKASIVAHLLPPIRLVGRQSIKSIRGVQENTSLRLINR